MQRPRRTAEFHEEPGTATKRNSRPHQPQRLTWAPSPAPGTAKKYNTRQSRIARPSSTDRQTLLQPSSALRGSRTTPQKTPTPGNKHTANRVLFTAEKQRNAHTDKKWVQEKAQEITDYLREVVAPGSIEGLPAEFFARSGSLRHMSTKQFVAIINYFLHCIWGGRFTVGANYVDDTVNILQKLQYPHQVNKSWLKTPNTQHSFGYVIMLFDFLMDFVPRQDDAEEFPFQEPQHHSQSISEEQLLQMPDAEFQAHLLRDSEKGFLLWDKQLMQEFGSLQQQTSDLLVQKRCGLPNMAALTEEVEQLGQQLGVLQQQRPHIREEDETEYCRLKQELHRTLDQLRIVRGQLELDGKHLHKLQAQQRTNKEQVVQLQHEIAEVRDQVQQQKYSVEQRDQFIETVAQLRHILQSLERTMRELQERLYHAQVLLSRSKKQLTDKIADFNGHIREMVYARLHTNLDELQLPLNPQKQDVKTRLQALRQLHSQAQKQLRRDMQQHLQLEQYARTVAHEVAVAIEPKTKALCASLTVAQKKLQSLVQLAVEQRSSMDGKLQDLEQRVQETKAQIEQLQEFNAQKQQKVQDMRNENELLMSNAEQEYDECANAREQFLNDYEAALKQADEAMKEFAEVVNQRDVVLQQFKEEEGKHQ